MKIFKIHCHSFIICYPFSILECLVDEAKFVILSPKDIVAACPYDSDDKIDWLLEHW